MSELKLNAACGTDAHADTECKKGGQIIEERARVLSSDWLAEGLTRLILHAPGIAARAKAGQFVHVLVPDGAHVLRRPISLMAFDPQAGTLTLAIQVKGRGTQILCAAKPGDSLQALGPLGNGFDARGAKCVYFVGGGVGVAPICCAMDAVAADGETAAQSRAFFPRENISTTMPISAQNSLFSRLDMDGRYMNFGLARNPARM